MTWAWTRRIGVIAGGACVACSTVGSSGAPGGAADCGVVAAPADASAGGSAMPSQGTFCALPGSVVSTTQGKLVVPGGSACAHDLSWLTLPVGFCAHYFATVPTARQLRFAPGGDLFVASPSSPTTGGANNGIAGIVALPDDDHDGVADANLTFLGGLPSVQGLMFHDGYLYYQDDVTIRRVAFQPGDRAPSAASEVVTRMDKWPQDMAHVHWTKVLDAAQDGTIYVTNGSTQGEACLSTRPVFGAIFRLNADGTTSEVARGFRNPIALRCEPAHDVCLAIELALDYSGSHGGREKILAVHQGDDWGYPCCATQGLPYSGVVYSDTSAVPDCSGVATENASFIIGHTPFGLDFEPGVWPSAPIDGHPGATWNGRAFVTLHGDYGTWSGARVVALALDPATGLPLPASELPSSGTPADDMIDFATGWDDGAQDHGRPGAVVFAPDGRLFIGDDQLGAVVWIAPVDLTRP